MKRRPMRLWSTVVSQPIEARRAIAPRSRSSAADIARGRRRSLQLRRYAAARAVRRRRDRRRHVRAGLDAAAGWRSRRARFARCHRQRAGGERCAAGDVGQVGADACVRRRCRWIAWHIDAGLVHEHVAARCPAAVAAPAARSALRVEPALEIRAGGSATTRTPCARAGSRRTRRTGRGKSPALAGVNSMWFVRPGIRSCLPCRFGTQKLWMTSPARARRWTGRPTGTCDLVSGGEMCERAGRRQVLDLPPPLVGGDADVDVVAVDQRVSRRSAE